MVRWPRRSTAKTSSSCVNEVHNAVSVVGESVELSNSRTMSSTLRPPMPPLALIESTTICACSLTSPCGATLNPPEPALFAPARTRRPP